MEEWKPVRGYEGLYEVSSEGRVKSCERAVNTFRGSRTKKERILSTNQTNGHGYLYVTLSNSGTRKNKYVHRLVAESFLPNPENLPCVNHKDHDTKNNSVENLEWVSQRENVLYSVQRMRKERSKFKRSTTGEKYVYERKYKTYTIYRVCITRAGYETVDKSFKTIEEAIEYRNKVLESRRGDANEKAIHNAG